MERETYEKVYVRSEADLPKPKGQFLCSPKLNKTGDLHLLWRIGGISDTELWLRSVDFYLKPLPALTEEEIREYVRYYLENHGIMLNVKGKLVDILIAMQRGEIHKWLEENKK